jgi:hypothetical protein
VRCGTIRIQADLYVRACFKPEEWAAVYSIHVLGGIDLYVRAFFKP